MDTSAPLRVQWLLPCRAKKIIVAVSSGMHDARKALLVLVVVVVVVVTTLQHSFSVHFS